MLNTHNFYWKWWEHFFSCEQIYSWISIFVCYRHQIRHSKCSVHCSVHCTSIFFLFSMFDYFKESKRTVNYSSMFNIKLCITSAVYINIFFCFLCSTVLKSQNTQLTTVDNHSMDTGEWRCCWTSHFKRWADVNISPKNNISAQPLKKALHKTPKAQ